MKLKKLLKDKKGQGLLMGLVGGAAILVVVTIITLVAVQTVHDADLVGTWGNASSNTMSSGNTTDRMISNLTKGVDEVSAKIPTILLIAAVVILFGAIVLLVQRSRNMTAGGGGGL